jgi:hypothetical protein
VRKSDKEIGAAAAAEDADDGVDDPLDGTAFGLDIWVQGVNPVVEYVSFLLLVYIQQLMVAL